MTHRGHVVAVAYMCSLDAISSCGYKNRNVRKFVRNHFPYEYRPFADRIYPDYRLSLVHAWNLFGDAAMSPGNEPIEAREGEVRFGVLNFIAAFEESVRDFLHKLETNPNLQIRALERYREVTANKRPPRTNTSTLIAGAIGFGLGTIATLLVGALRSYR
jgi:hypothetical protein